MARIRPYRPTDRDAVAEVCVRTADAGADGTGILDDDDIWAAIFVLPYVERHPELAAVAETDDGRVAGYLVATPDTRAFEDWFQDEWWPRFQARWPKPGDPTTEQDGILAYAYARRGDAAPLADRYPAHLHVDLLPEVQGQGFGRRLIAELVEELRGRGVGGLHLVASARNEGALAFYRRLGFAALPSPPGSQAFGVALDDAAPWSIGEDVGRKPS